MADNTSTAASVNNPGVTGASAGDNTGAGSSMDNNMFGNIDEYTENLRKKLNLSVTQLSSKKDRAQTSSSSALSVSTVVILKTVVDAGPAGIDYYAFNMFLVVTCITLQVFIGALLLIMFRVSKNKKQSDNTLAMLSEGRTGENPSFVVTPGASPPAAEDDESKQLVDSPTTCCSCCSACTCCRDDYDDDDDDMTMEETVDQQLAQLTTKFMKQLLATVKAQDDLARTDPDDKAKVHEAAKEIQRNMNILNTILKEIKTTSTLQGLIWERKRLTKLQWYQTIIEFMLYATFIINAFLVGFSTIKSP